MVSNGSVGMIWQRDELLCCSCMSAAIDYNGILKILHQSVVSKVAL